MTAFSRLLFVGNSYTFRNDLPGLIAQMAPHEIASQSIVAGGASLRLHLNKGEVAKTLNESNWDIVILQEQSTLPVKNCKRFHENVRELHQIIKGHDAPTALYQTWARKNAPETQEALSSAYESIAEEIGALLIPVGKAWQIALKMQPDTPLFDADGSHPSSLGSYLAACVFVAALWQKDPRGLTVPEDLQIEDAHTALVRDAAWQSLQA
ncbi:MAG TPA: DUF4886 domain-containing protein [Abditibacteriaceae bacterium]|jgi:hypothetical protein